ncbi:integral membrane protein (TIGR01906 family) [Clostridium punense]|uniref:Integral membrane protein (TIGR01906 family) n=1 Tax=Clostridium punense TaxID=1054297 RepID=A0ABS4JZ42_9CLOT|nr:MULTISPECIES: TIGR01906 family membrane protein [Clostridium]EQB90095.1 hypothetical protein M918_01780 [Clostridium sp. BL8]MBP2020802.1 integral membrane protein (TIGR01906 family) [Clostridium punense]
MKNRLSKLTTIILSILTIYSVLMLSTLVVTKSNFIYYFDINYLNIPKMSGLNIGEIKLNYNYTIDYLFDNSISEFKPPTLSSSEDGSQHFFEVRNLFNLGTKLLILSLIICSVLGFIMRNYKLWYKFLKYSAIILVSIPVASLALLKVDFTKAFTLFHKIMFNNDKWLLDPVTDPIINIMPEEFFAHCGIAIIVISTIWGVILFLLYRFIHRKQICSNK